MKENQTTKYRIQIDSDLFAYLNPESGENAQKWLRSVTLWR